MALLYSIPGRCHLNATPYTGLLVCLSDQDFYAEGKSSGDLLRSTAWSGSVVHVLITTFGERALGMGRIGLSRSYCHFSLAQKTGPPLPSPRPRYSDSLPPRSKLLRRSTVWVAPSRSPITISSLTSTYLPHMQSSQPPASPPM